MFRIQHFLRRRRLAALLTAIGHASLAHIILPHLLHNRRQRSIRLHLPLPRTLLHLLWGLLLEKARNAAFIVLLFRKTMVLLEAGRNPRRRERQRFSRIRLHLPLPINQFSGFLSVSDAKRSLLEFFHFLENSPTHSRHPLLRSLRVACGVEIL